MKLLDLGPIKERLAAVGPVPDGTQRLGDLQALVAEVERLRAELGVCCPACGFALADLTPAPAAPVDERRAPVQGDPGARFGEGYPAGTISWQEHLAAYEDYAKRYGGDQSAERLAARGGFGYAELTDHLGHEPKTWRPR